MRILQLGKFYPIQGGVEKVMFDLLDGLSNKGISCDMLCANANIRKKLRVIQISNISKLICTKTWLKKFATMISPQMIFVLRNICKDYDIIHIHHPDPMAALSLFFSGYNGKVVLHWHSDILKQKILLKIFLPLQTWLINRADIIVGTTPVYIEKSPYLKDVSYKCTYLPIGINPIVDNEKITQLLRKKFVDKKIIFSLGRLVEYKGYKYLIDAAKYLPKDYIILIGGSGPLKRELQAQIDSANLQNKVILLGRVTDEELPSYYKLCSLYCLPSIMKTEAYAIVQIEAMSCEKPVVATKIPDSGVSWVNEDNVSGINVPIKDGKAIATAIETLLSDKELYTRMSSGAKHRFNSLFLKDMMVDKCVKLYDKLIVY